MANEIRLIVFPIRDIGNTTRFYSRFLGKEPYIESPYYVGYKVGDLEVGLDPNSTVGPIAYIDVEDIVATLEEMTEAGAEIVKDIQDVGNGLLITQVVDANGNVVGLRQQS